MSKSSSRVWKLLGALSLALMSGTAGAQSGAGYPAKPVRILTAGAGAASDVVARLVANEISVPFGQSVVIENRPAGFILATGVSKAAPDGYTLLLWGGALWIAPLFEEAPYDAVRDFAPIAPLTRSPYLLVVHPGLPVRSVADLIKLAKSKPGELNFSSGPTGSSSHIAGELLKSMAGISIVRVAYKGGIQDTADLLSGQIQMTFGSGTSVGPHVRTGKMRAIATSGSKRSVLFPDFPTVADTLPGFVTESLVAFFAPARTPDAIIRRLNQETMRAIDKPVVREQLLKSGQEVMTGGSPEELAELVRSDIARVEKLVKEGGMKPGG